MEKILKLYTYNGDAVESTPFPNEEEQVVITDFQYDVTRMGNIPTISAKVMHRLCLDDLWTDNVYAEFNGEKYFVMNTPSSNKDNDDTRYEHEIELLSEREVLNHVYFIDAVQENEEIDKVKSNSTKVIFMGDINEFAARLNSSLAYSNLDYTVAVDEGITTENVLVSFEDKYFYEALQEGYNLYKVPFYFDGKTIHFGYTDDAIPNVFKYGFDNALLSISKQNTNYNIATRCTGYGSSDNIPYYYPNATAKGDVKAVSLGTNQALSDSNIRVFNLPRFSEKMSVSDEIKYSYVDISGAVKIKEVNKYVGGIPTMHNMIDGFNVKLNKGSYGFYVGSADIEIVYEVLKDCKLSFGIKHSVSGQMVTVSWSGDEGVSGFIKAGTYRKRITFNYTTVSLTAGGDEYIIVKDVLSLNVYEQKQIGWNINGDFIKLSDYGVELINISESDIPDGDGFRQEIGSLIPSTGTLMPPIYRQTGGAEQFYNAINNKYPLPEGGGYYTFENEYNELNPHEIKVSFEDIKPSIVGIKNSLGQRIDKFLDFAWDNDDNDEVNTDGEYIHPYFFAKLPKYDGENGFNLFDHASESGNMTISMTSGTCGACNFEVGVGEKSDKNTVQVDANGNLLRDSYGDVRCGREGKAEETPQDRQQDTRNYEVWIALKKDDSTYGTILPSKKRNLVPSTDDTFVILNINLPQAYIDAAEKRLEDEIIKYMYENNVEKFNFEIAFSRIYLAQNPQVLAMLNENARIIIEYNGQQHTLYVDSYSYKMSSGEALPEISVTLTDTINVGSNSLKNAITSVTKEIMNGSNGDILAQGTKYFIRKDVEDAAQKKITFEQGVRTDNIESKNFTSGTLGIGHKLFTDPNTGQSYCEIDRLYVRMKAYFDTLEIKEVSHIGGELILTPASMKCSRVEVIEPMPIFYVDGTQKVYSDGKLAYTARKYRCYFNADDGDEAIQNQFVVGDLAYCKQFNIESGIYTNVSNRFYWYEVTGVGSNYIEITEGRCAEGSDIPKEGDTIVSLGNKTDAFRQNAIILSTVGINAPSKVLYQGINGYSLLGKAIIEEGFDPESNQAYQKIYGKTYIGARDESSYISFDPTTNKMKVKAELEILGGSGIENIEGIGKYSNESIAKNLGYDSYEDMAAEALEGNTIISGGYINTSLIEAKAITADMINADGIIANEVDITGKITATSGSFEGEVYANKGILGAMTIKTGSYEYGIFYEGDNTELSMRPGLFMNIPYNSFAPSEEQPQANVLLYLQRRRKNLYDRSIYAEGISEFYGRVGIGKASNTGFSNLLPALVSEGILCAGQFCLETRKITTTSVLDGSSSYIVVNMSSSGSYINLPSSNLSDGQTYYIRRIGGNNFSVYGSILNEYNSTVTKVDITGSGVLCIFTYIQSDKKWVFNFIN